MARLRSGLDWSDLQFFHEVARSGTLSAAARHLQTDHATVGRRIEALESAMGVRLFERHGRGYRLTRKGEQLLPVVEAMAQQVSDADVAAPGTVGGTVGGTVRLSTLEGFGTYFLQPRIGPLLRENPGLVLEWLTIQQIVALSRREADVTVTLQPPTTGRFVSEKLVDYSLQLYGSAAYLAAAPPLRRSADLAQHVLIGYVDDLIFTRGLDYLGTVTGGQAVARLQNSSLGAQLEAANAGIGLCVLPCFIARSAPRLLPLLEDEIALTRSYWMSVPADDADSARVRRVRAFVRDTVAATGAGFFAP